MYIDSLIEGDILSDQAEIKADIVPYTDEYADYIRKWIDTPETFRFVCRGKDFPPPENIVKSWQRDSVTSFILIESRKPVAYGELWKREDETAVEIAHVLVDQYKRSMGYGTKMVELLYNRASSRSDITKIIINLYQDNPIALGCFMKAGFEISSTTSYTTGLRMVKYILK